MNLSHEYANEPMMEMFIFETNNNIEQLESIILNCEKTSCYSQDTVNEIFRIMHTIKGSSAMMLFNDISSLAHSIEDLFFFLRERKPENINYATLSDLVLEGVDFIKVELQKIKSGDNADGDVSILIGNVQDFLELLKEVNPSVEAIIKSETLKKQQYYISPENIIVSSKQNLFYAVVCFENGCEMENIRAYTIIHNLMEFTEDILYFPENIIEDDDSVYTIREQGFKLLVKTDKSYDEMLEFLNKTIFLESVKLTQLDDEDQFNQIRKDNVKEVEIPIVKMPQVQNLGARSQVETETQTSTTQSIISVNVLKLDKLMDLVGEMVIAEAMVTQNPDLMGLELENFQKAARQLHKITSELQDVVMSIRMVPLSTTFQKMHRIVRDMSRKLDKEIQLDIIGEETEVDKNIIEHIADPLMHIVRNSIDHGIEATEDRVDKGKSRAGSIILEAKNAGSDVLIIVRDDGRGLNKKKILQRAKDNGLLTKPEDEMTDREIYNQIFHPGFSTKDSITEFSGRGVGMDVVTKNIESVGGSISIDSTEDIGTTITLKIPLTLAIIDGMNVRVGKSRYTIPTTVIKESFRPKECDIIKYPDGSEMIMVRGQCYKILRIHEYYNVQTNVTTFAEGILIMVEQEDESICLFADKLLGQQQVVVKPLPDYIRKVKNVKGLSGCTLLGDGSISLIIDVLGLINIK